ncbi:MAG: Ig-like domain-containing protein [Lachnospiraceae bacterium]|nr:Ig-like domain-containing protein [Lachnospiraceae bacterium]
MNFKKYRILFAALAVMAGVAFGQSVAHAADLSSLLNPTTTETETEEEEDEEEPKEELASAVLAEKLNAKIIGSAGSYVSVGESGVFDIDRSDSEYIEEDDLSVLTRVTWFSSDTSVITVDSSTGSYRGVTAGNASIYLTGYADYKYTSSTGIISYESEELFKYSINISVLPNLSGLTFDKTQESVFVNAKGVAKGDDGAGYAEFTISGIDYIFDSSKDAGALNITADTNDFSYKMEQNVLKLYCNKAGDVTVNVGIGPVNKELLLHVTRIKQKGSTSVLLVNGKSTTLKLVRVEESGGSAETVDPSEITWKASNGRVSVSDTGKVKAKKLGATCIRGTYQGFTYFWVVNVCTPTKAKVISAGRQIAKGVYSQPRRMSEGYYDCSSLVWRAYKPYGYNFGSNYNAPVAATEGNYLYNKGKMIDGAIGKSNTQKLKLRPGDLLFEGGANNGRWNGIYHVEMFAGYTVSGVDDDGKPVYANTWVNRPDGYYGYGTANDYVGRP